MTSIQKTSDLVLVSQLQIATSHGTKAAQKAYRDAMLRIALENNVPVIDIFEIAGSY